MIVRIVSSLPVLACLLLSLCACATQETTRPEVPAGEVPAPATMAGKAGARASQESFPQKTADGILLASVLGDGVRIDLEIGKCTGEECPVLVALRQDGSRLAQLRTAWPSAGNEVYPEEMEPGWGAGDPLRSAGAEAWATGEEEAYLGLVARPVDLAPGVAGMLLDQRTGFEHLRRRHELFVARNNKLERVWEGTEGAGPAWSSADIVKLQDGRDGLVYFDGFRYPSPDQPDRLDISLFEWSETSGALEESDYSANVPSIALDGFPSVSAAHNFRAQQSACMGLFWVLPAARAQGAAGKFVLVLPSLNESALTEKRAEVEECAPGRAVRNLNLVAP